MPTYKEYDPITGQVFHQWDVPVPGIMSSSWNWVSNPVDYFSFTHLTPHSLSVGVPPFRGPVPLVDMCLRASILHINEIDKAHLQYLPTRLVGRIWKDLKRTGAPSVETWKLIVTRFTGDEEATKYICPLLMRYLTSVKKIQPLAAYIEPLVSNTFDFLAHLTITGNIKGNTPELLQLVQLKNLAVLEFIQPDEEDMLASPRLTDSILREWSRTPDPFPVLRVLRVWANDSTTRHSIRYINAFPSLVLYDVAGKKRDWAEKSEEPDWKSEKMTWARELDHTLPEHFHLLEDDIPDDRWKLKPEASANITFDLSRALQKPETELAPFPRGNYEAYYDICKADKSTKVCRPPPASHNLYSVYLRPSETMVSESLWGFLVYCHIGRVISDRDLLAQGLEIRETAFVLKDIILPPRPMLHLVLADEDYDPQGRTEFASWGKYRDSDSVIYSRVRGRFQTQLTFIRKDYHLAKKRSSGLTTTGSESTKRAPDVPSSTHRPLKKRRDISSILESFDNIG
ncbi:hypothetical protein F4782DRAFT_202541 [Xylaria castorea]|nr:hypothetical protein F4782DRAFT_202541 [Xylaria castorea]